MCYTLCGTCGYLAPEILLETGYNKSIDWFAVGAVLFHLLTGSEPFPTIDDQYNMLTQINKKESVIVPPKYLSQNARKILKQFLQYKPVKRLGAGSSGNLNHEIIKIQNHPWFNGFNWNRLLKQEMKAPQQFPSHFTDKHYKMRKTQKNKHISLI